jgi:hypothetical protein
MHPVQLVPDPSKKLRLADEADKAAKISVLLGFRVLGRNSGRSLLQVSSKPSLRTKTFSTAHGIDPLTRCTKLLMSKQVPAWFKLLFETRCRKRQTNQSEYRAHIPRTNSVRYKKIVFRTGLTESAISTQRCERHVSM